jgi:uncharacterized repeat protein (TIGR03803 family)
MNGQRVSGLISRSLAFVLVSALGAALPLQAQKFSILHVFHGGTDGNAPLAGLVADANGNLYGTTEGGGDTRCGSGWGCGTVFKLDASGNESILHSFTGMPDGQQPMDGLVMDNSGSLYGTTYEGGSSGYGAVFKVDASGKESILYSFGPYPDGSFPSGGLAMDRDGNLYGTTQEGGTGTSCWGGCGTVFELDPTGKETILLNFDPPAEYPAYSALILDAAGNLYGVTSGGNSCCLGTAFKISKGIAAGAITLHTFTGWTEGVTPEGNRVHDAKGWPIRHDLRRRRSQLRLRRLRLWGSLRTWPEWQGNSAARLHWLAG